MDGEVLTEVPLVLKQLVRRIVRGFYSISHSIVIDVLVKYPCVKEDDILELLNFERKQLRALLNTLKNDKFIKSRMTVETDIDGHTTKHNYYFINFQVFVNVVKYKMDNMRRKIETEERENTSRASFICEHCAKTYTDYEINEIMDFMTGELSCSYCSSTVIEDESAIPKKDARSSLAKFNEQMQPVFNMLKDCEDLKLSSEILEPAPTDIKHISKTHGQNQPKSLESWSGETNKGRAFNYVNMDTQVTISMDEQEGLKNRDNVDVKERPIWMTHSTVDGIPTDSMENVDDNIQEASTSRGAISASKNNDIIQTLLIHEKKAAPGVSARKESSSSESENEFKPVADDGVGVMDSDEDDEDTFLVEFEGRKISYNDVTPDMVARMSQSERDEYSRVGQELYENMYE